MDIDRHSWEKPGAHQVLPGVYRIPLPLPGDHLKAVNVYAIADDDQLVLIDGGWALADAEHILASALTSIEYAVGDVREFLVTHLHRDHYTQAIAHRRAHGARVSLGEGEQAALDLTRRVRAHPEVEPMRAAGASELSRRIAEWRPERDLTNWEYPDRWLPDGIDIPLRSRTLRVIATPGHTRGHVVYHDAQHGALFAGDHVLPHITPSIGIEPNRPYSPLRNYLGSLELVRALPDATLLPAHGPVTASVHERIDALFAHHDVRLKQTADAVDAGASTGYEVATALPWTRRLTKFDDLDLFNQMIAVQETIAHLRVLVERGWLVESEVDGVWHFSRA